MMTVLVDAVRQLKTAVILLLLLVLMTGVIYPALITLIAQQFFSWRANGSLMAQDGVWVGSQLIGQEFNAPDMFWGRPSATTAYAYNAANSSGSNLGPTNPFLIKAVKDRIARLQSYADHHNAIPVDLVASSASGLDPEISPYAAFYQVNRIAKATHLPVAMINDLIINAIQARTYKMLGEPRVNVLELNIALKVLRSANGRAPTKS